MIIRNHSFFVKEYVKAIEEDRAAIFAGAGLSKPAGYVDWKGLLKEIAEEINLDVNKESDLIALAQYYINANNNDRGRINQKLIEEFSATSVITENHLLLSKLPIRYYWTTNYDRMIEKALELQNKVCDIKIKSEQFTYSVPKSDAIIYKMHGDVSLPHEAVLSKDDYENYNIERELFTISLKGDLVSKTFLFIGFSFDDPNLEYILSRVRVLVGNSKRQHYCFMKEIDEKLFETHEDYLYAKIHQEHRINDLGRYGINIIMVEEYNQITNILKQIEKKIIRKNVFISGSCEDYGSWGEERVLKFCSQLSKVLMRNQNNLIFGFGLGIGGNIITGALEELYSTPKMLNNTVEDRLKLKPFPQKKELFSQYRKDMLDQVGIAIFIFGNKKDASGKTVIADGMNEEFSMAVERNIVPIPVGATGFMAEALYHEVMNEFDNYVPGTTGIKESYEKLGNYEMDDAELIQTIITIVKYFMEV